MKIMMIQYLYDNTNIAVITVVKQTYHITKNAIMMIYRLRSADILNPC